MKYFFTLITLTCFFLNGVVAQDTLRLLNGNVMEVEIGSISETEITFKPQLSRGKSFQVRSTREIFSFQKQGKKEVIMYKYNPEIGNFYKEDEMRNFMVGERHAEDYHNTCVTKISAVGVGVVAGYFVADGGGLIVASPLVFSAVMMIPKARIQKNDFNKDLRTNQPYRAGYRRVAKGKRFLNNLAYSTLGMIGSFVLFEYTNVSFRH